MDFCQRPMRGTARLWLGGHGGKQTARSIGFLQETDRIGRRRLDPRCSVEVRRDQQRADGKASPDLGCSVDPVPVAKRRTSINTRSGRSRSTTRTASAAESAVPTMAWPPDCRCIIRSRRMNTSSSTTMRWLPMEQPSLVASRTRRFSPNLQGSPPSRDYRKAPRHRMRPSAARRNTRWTIWRRALAISRPPRPAIRAVGEPEPIAQSIKTTASSAKPRVAWCGRGDSNPHRHCCPTDFLTSYGFHRPRLPARHRKAGLWSGLSLHHAPEERQSTGG